MARTAMPAMNKGGSQNAGSGPRQNGEATIWRPQSGPQKALVDCPLAEVFFGGARGDGKTDGVLGKWALKERLYGKDFNAVMFRRTTVSSEDAIERSKQIYRPLGGVFNEGKLVWRMPNGGRIAFAYLDSVEDAQEYQGRNLTDARYLGGAVWMDENDIVALYGEEAREAVESALDDAGLARESDSFFDRPT